MVLVLWPNVPLLAAASVPLLRHGKDSTEGQKMAGIRVIQHKNSAFSERDWNSSPSADRITTDLTLEAGQGDKSGPPVNDLWKTPPFPAFENFFATNSH